MTADYKNLLPDKAKVKRDREWKEIEAEEIVPGDIIKLEKGNEVPADAILYDSKDMKVANVHLTGEYKDQRRHHKKTLPNPFESPNVVFYGT